MGRLNIYVIVFVSAVLAACAVPSVPRTHVKDGSVQQAMTKYLASTGFKAYAIQVDADDRRNNESYGFAFDLPDQVSASRRALEFCQEQDLANTERCVVYAEGDFVVFVPKTSSY